MIVNKCEVKTYTDSYPRDYGEDLTVKSADYDDKMVYLEIDGKRIKVVGKNLITAINNCMNTNAYY